MAPLTLEQAQAALLKDGAPEVDTVGRSREIRIFSFARPWFRAFHFAWMSFFLAFTGWFAFAPVLNTIKEDPNMNVTSGDIATSNILSVTATIFVRIALGPILEKYGPRPVQSIILFFGGLLVLLSGTIQSAGGLIAIRFFIGFVGGAFVPTQFWTSVMYSKEVVGTANALTGGWGNLGGGVASLLMGGLLQGFGPDGLGLPESEAWRYAMIIPGCLMIGITIPMFFFSDDSPYGTWANKHYDGQHWHDSEHGGNVMAAIEQEAKDDTEKAIESKTSLKEDTEPLKGWEGYDDYRVWVMAIQYGCCFGVELAINNTMAIYLYNEFTTDPDCVDDPNTPELDCAALSKSEAAMVASIFGLMNLFARALGGIGSDYLYKKKGIRGRTFTLFWTLLFQGIMLLIFSQIRQVAFAIVMLVFFSLFVQASEGATYAIVPFVNKRALGKVAGLVGAGGNIGAISWLTMFKGLATEDSTGLAQGYFYLSFVVMASAFLTFTYSIEGKWLHDYFKSEEANVTDETESATSESIRFPNVEKKVEETTETTAVAEA